MMKGFKFLFLANLSVVFVCSMVIYASQEPTPTEVAEILALAEQGDAEAQNELGSWYYAGRGLPQDDTEAARWIGLAADQGHVPAQYNFGLLYFRNRGVDGNDTEAAKWYRRAAEQGYAPAQGALGYMFAYGAGVEENAVMAYMWLELARNGATDEFTRRLYAQQRYELAQRMAPAEIAEATRLAQEWEAARPRQR